MPQGGLGTRSTGTTTMPQDAISRRCSSSSPSEHMTTKSVLGGGEWKRKELYRAFTPAGSGRSTGIRPAARARSSRAWHHRAGCRTHVQMGRSPTFSVPPAAQEDRHCLTPRLPAARRRPQLPPRGCVDVKACGCWRKGASSLQRAECAALAMLHSIASLTPPAACSAAHC